MLRELNPTISKFLIPANVFIIGTEIGRFRDDLITWIASTRRSFAILASRRFQRRVIWYLRKYGSMNQIRFDIIVLHFEWSVVYCLFQLRYHRIRSLFLIADVNIFVALNEMKISCMDHWTTRSWPVLRNRRIMRHPRTSRNLWRDFAHASCFSDVFVGGWRKGLKNM